MERPTPPLTTILPPPVARQCPRRFLTEWPRREFVARDGVEFTLDKHFRTFSHEAIERTMGPTCAVDATGHTSKKCHKHCLHSFNFIVKTRFEDFRVASRYQGPPPDVRVKAWRCHGATIVNGGGGGRGRVLQVRMPST